MKPPHYAGNYHVQARHIRDTANANPDTKCWRCGHTLADHPPHKNGRPPYWTAGHILDSDPNSPLAPEASTCNYQAGGRQRHTQRTPNTW